MTQPTHPELVAALAKPGDEIIKDLTPNKAHLWHMATGISTEAGEIESSIKKVAIYNKHLNSEAEPGQTLLTNLIEEMGDLEFYLEGLRAAIGVTRAEVLDHNITKLQTRYSSGKFSNQQAQDRKDKQ